MATSWRSYLSLSLTAVTNETMEDTWNFMETYIIKRIYRPKFSTKTFDTFTYMPTERNCEINIWNIWCNRNLSASRGSIPGTGRHFILFATDQIGSGAHRSSCPMGTGVLSPGVKQQGREADHSPSSGAEVKEAWTCTSAPPYVSMVWRLVKHRIRLHVVVLS